MLPIFLLGLVACSSTLKDNTDLPPGYSTPEAEGISSRSILELVEALEKEQPDAIHSLMLRRHGKIVAEGWWAPYHPDTPHMLYSLSKSFTSTAIGMAQEEGLLSIDDPVISFFPEQAPAEPSDNLKAMRIRDLLKMNSGHQWGTSGGMMGGQSWAEGFLAREVQFKPGTHFVYNSGATYMLSAIVQKVAGKTLLDYLTPRLFEPLGIEDPTWETDPDGINTGGWGLSIKTEDISKLGQLYLQKGRWNGKQLVPESWVEEATTLQTSNGSNPESDWEQGYGYQFWRCRHDFYRGDGAFGQFCIVMPEYDAVLAITSGSNDMQGIMNLAWKYLLPAMKENPLPADPEGSELLKGKLQGLVLGCAMGEDSSPVAEEVSGKNYTMDPGSPFIQAVSVDFQATPVAVTITTTEGDQTFKAGYGSWEKGILANPALVSREIAVSGAWEAPDTYVVIIPYIETPHMVKFTFRFEGSQVFLDTELNVSFGPTKLEQIKGMTGS